MSYWLEGKCGECVKGGEQYKSKCVDAMIIQGALNTIHSIGSERGHLGSGTIKLDCQQFEAKVPEEAGS